MTNKQKQSLLSSLNTARDNARLLAASARYWARDVRRCLRVGQCPLASAGLANIDRALASEWRTKVRTLEARLAA